MIRLCRHCGIRPATARHGLATCIGCRGMSSKKTRDAWIQRNRDRVRVLARRWRLAHPEQAKAAERRYNEKCRAARPPRAPKPPPPPRRVRQQPGPPPPAPRLCSHCGKPSDARNGGMHDECRRARHRERSRRVMRELRARADYLDRERAANRERMRRWRIKAQLIDISK